MHNQPCFTYYGDDLTGSTDALEALSSNGISTVLFLGIPSETRLSQFQYCRAYGIAGESRSKSPEWMSSHLPGVFQWLKELGAPICQYKVCSTFDSSSGVGSIGRVLEIGRQVFHGEFVPIVVAAPRLNRWVAFANLFAGVDGQIYRIDRHPTMANHPVTPMTDGDLRVHLAKQTERKISSLDLLSLNDDGGRSKLTGLLRDGCDGILFDGLSEMHSVAIASLLWSERVPFVIGSSGFTYGLATHLRSLQWTCDTPSLPVAAPTDRLIVLSGSGSPVTERQIRWAIANGFSEIRLDAAALVNSVEASRTREEALSKALGLLQGGRSVVLYSAMGPKDCNQTQLREELGGQMGILLRELLLKSGVKRAVIAGGDTSSHAGQQLGIFALTMLASLEPGAPLCQTYSDEKSLSGLELVLKGGQVGSENFFGTALRGGV